MRQILLVGLGGGVGAICRYVLSLLPVNEKFPCSTLLVNLAGAVLIGFLAGCAGRIPRLAPELRLLLQTGFCSGFTTFSTFSLETISLLQAGRYLAGGGYAALSLAGCLAGVLLGQALARLIPLR